MQAIMRVCCVFLLVLFSAACSFSIKVGQIPTTKTELEEQVLGSYKEIDDEIVLISTVRGNKDDKELPLATRVKYARQNQKFNLDDIEELKNAQILGEKADGHLELVPAKVSQTQAPPASALRLAKILIEEENRDRAVIWQEIIDRQPNLNSGDLDEVRKTYASLKRKECKAGQWYQNSNGVWVRKSHE